MGDVINLRLARKTRKRAAAGAEAAANRVRFGRSNTEKRAGEADITHHERTLDGAKIDPPQS